MLKLMVEINDYVCHMMAAECKKNQSTGRQESLFSTINFIIDTNVSQSQGCMQGDMN